MEALEQKERAYFETMNQYDAIFAAMEADFNQKLATSQVSRYYLYKRRTARSEKLSFVFFKCRNQPMKMDSFELVNSEHEISRFLLFKPS